MLNVNHKKLDVWKLSIAFVSMIYDLTSAFPKSENGLFAMLTKLKEKTN